MELERLLALGFTRNEALVYIELIRAGSLTAKQLIQKTGLHKKLVYDNLERLMEKGVVSSVLLEHAREFHLEPADSLLEYFEKQQASLAERKSKAQQVISEINRTKQNKPVVQQTRMIVGVKGVRQFFAHAVTNTETNYDYVSLGAPKESVEVLGEHFWINLNNRQKETKHTGRLLFNSSLRGWNAGGAHEQANEVRYLDAALEPLTQTVVYGDTVGIIVWSPKPVATIIEDRNVATTYRDFFEVLWKQAKK
jgi:DNA-binding MarR family transcriptional regulator